MLPTLFLTNKSFSLNYENSLSLSLSVLQYMYSTGMLVIYVMFIIIIHTHDVVSIPNAKNPGTIFLKWVSFSVSQRWRCFHFSLSLSSTTAIKKIEMLIMDCRWHNCLHNDHLIEIKRKLK